MLMPLPERMSWKNPPIVTIILIILNISIFLIFQLKDNEAYLNASKFYGESGLANIEIKAYAKWAKENRNYDSLYLDLPENTEMGETAADYLYDKMKKDNEFLKKLEDGTAISASDPDHEKWVKLRTEYEKLRSEAVFYSYGFIPGERRPVSYISHMFLHGGFSHLIGNMIFLWITGVFLEAGTGGAVFLTLYLIGGLASVLGFSLFTGDSMVPLVGASGAISAIMGAFSVIYRMKPVRVFINLGIYIDTIKIPAIVFLPLWLGNEIYSFYSDTSSSVAYMAHASGLAAGAVMGLSAARSGLVKKDKIDEDGDEKTDPSQEKLVRAMNHLSRLEIDKAIEVLNSILETDPNHEEAARKLFDIQKNRGDVEGLHGAASRYLKLLVASTTDPSRIADVYDSYVAIVQRPRLEPRLYAEIALRMAISGRHEKALALAIAVTRISSDDDKKIPVVLLKTAKMIGAAGKTAEKDRCLEAILAAYPESEAANEAKISLG